MTKGLSQSTSRRGPENDDSLAGKLIIAMPNIGDPRFDRAVIYLFAHRENGAMGLIVNKTADDLSFANLLSEHMTVSADVADIPVRFGGPVEVTRGFVLHSPDYHREATIVVDDEISMTATVDVLKAIAAGRGPDKVLFAVGYAGWGPGQLEREIQENGWLLSPSDLDIVFGDDDPAKWSQALALIGVDPSLLSSSAGRA